MDQYTLLVDVQHERKSEEAIPVWEGGLCCYCIYMANKLVHLIRLQCINSNPESLTQVYEMTVSLTTWYCGGLHSILWCLVAYCQ